MQAFNRVREVAVRENDVLAFLEKPFSGKPRISPEFMVNPKYVNGYGPHLSRVVYQAPPEVLDGFRAGLTINLSGWSSFPPHHFERNGKWPEGFEEKFLFFLDYSENWLDEPIGFLLSSGNGAIEKVRDGQVLRIRPGLHAVTAAPGCYIRYVWAYTAKELPEKPIDEGTGRYAEDS